IVALRPARRMPANSTAVDNGSRTRDDACAMKRLSLCALLVLAAAALPIARGQEKPPLRLGIAGLVHGHVDGFLRGARGRSDVEIVGIFDPDPALLRSYGERYNVPEAARFTDLKTMLDRVKPEAIASFTNTHDHPAVVEAVAARRLTVMM